MASKARSGGKEAKLVLGALGIVFGDIGTSPLYALRECFTPERGVAIDRDNIIGVVSLLIWSLSLVVCVKYLIIVLRADNEGEGGILALVSLVSRYLPRDGVKRIALMSLLGIIGASLIFSDGMITPAVSVLSAIEGLEVISPGFAPSILPLSLAMLILLFLAQARGTNTIGKVFGPITALWFVVIAVLGAWAIAVQPEILLALNPLEAIRFVVNNGSLTFRVLGAVFLAMTGAEALYADLGHFGRRPIRKGWFVLVFPALLLNYIGQGAYLLAHPADNANLFFRLAPSWSMYPLVILATAATIVASQAVISGAFSLAQQSVLLGYFPRIQVRHTSDETKGQVYVPLVNWFLLFGTAGLVIGFKSSDALSSAYGIAVSATMLMTTCLTIVLARKGTKTSLWIIVPLGLFFLILDSVFFASNAVKIVSGGWIVVLMAVMMIVLMKTWMDGRSLFGQKIRAFRLSPEIFVDSISLAPPHRVPGTAVYLTADPNGIPKAMLHNLKHNKVLHELTIILSVETIDVPRLPDEGRCSVSGPRGGIWFVSVRFGFFESPDLPAALQHVEIPGFDNDPMKTTYFTGREAIVLARKSAMSRWRRRLFVFMFTNALSPTHFFKLPPERVVELGSQTEL